MDDAELVGGALLGFPDPTAGAATLTGLLTGDADHRPCPVAPELMMVLRSHFASATPQRVAQACAEGAAWAAGRASAPAAGSWELVATVPSPLPSGLRRTTAETLIHLLNNSRARARLVAPFVDEVGVGYLTDAIVAATLRRVAVEVFLPVRSTNSAAALGHLAAAVAGRGRPGRLSLRAERRDSPWAHLKVLTADGTAAYIGSANLTGHALNGASNLELGVLVRGPGVEAIDHLLDLIRDDRTGDVAHLAPDRVPGGYFTSVRPGNTWAP